MKEKKLEILKLNKYFGNNKVLEDVTLTLTQDSILGLVGENGAGKSTMMNILGGNYERTSGEILIDGVPYLPNNARDAVDAGVAFIHQELNIFTNLTVAENIFLDNINERRPFFSYKEINQNATQIMNDLGIDVDVKEKLESLPMGKRQLVEIAKAVSKNARIVIFDEPTTSLSNAEKEKLFHIIRDLSKQHISMIYISHTLEDVLNICDEIAVLRDGRITAQKHTAEWTKDAIVTKMIGREIDNLYPYAVKNIGEVVLRTEDLTQTGVFEKVDIALKSGEITGLFGLVGAGRSELVRSMFGLDKINAGCLHVGGEKITQPNPIKSKQLGMAFVTENRREEGLLLNKSVKDNIVMTRLQDLSVRPGYVSDKKAERESQRMVDKLKIRTQDQLHQLVRELSGGNQQKVVIGKWLLCDPKIFILDEPTKGIDVGAKYDVYNYMNNLVAEGAAILMISSEVEELMGICDRIVVMSKGTIRGEFDRSDYDQEKILKMALGGM
jgi:ribose transport system ATP-binding protein